jgi:hypothetical protein
MRIGVDLDGVLYNFTASLSDYIGHAAGQWYPYRPSCWEFYETDWGMSLTEYLAWFEQGVDAGWIFAVGAPAKGSIEALHALKARGHTIHLITDRNVGEKAKVNTTLWLSAHGVPYDTLTFCNGNKASLVNVDLAVDDRPKLVDEYRAAGVEAYCMGFDERTDMKANEWYIPYDWDNFQLIVEEAGNMNYRPIKPTLGRKVVRPIGLGVDEDYADTPNPYARVEKAVNQAVFNDLCEHYEIHKATSVREPRPDHPSYYNQDTASKPAVRTFDTGATRDLDDTKDDPEGFYTPRVIHRFNQYMTHNRHLADGSVRDSDNWQKGIPREAYAKSLWRHHLAAWSEHRAWVSGDSTYDRDQLEVDLCGVIFNAQGMLDTILKNKEVEAERDTRP